MAGVERILHLGDWTDPSVPDLFAAIAPTDGVAGNNDPPELVRRLGRRKVVEVEGTRLGLTHGDLGPGRTTPQRALRAFAGEPALAAVLFGHSHTPLVQRLADGRWLLNPGSPTDKRRQPRYTWALLEVADGAVIRVSIEAFDRLPR